MSHSKDQEYINAIWNRVDYKQIGGEAFSRFLNAHPCAQKDFNTLGHLGCAEAVCHNDKVIAYGEKILPVIGEALKYLDNLNGEHAKLKQDLIELLVDRGNFKHFVDSLVIALARNFRKEFTPEIQADFERAFRKIADALENGDH